MTDLHSARDQASKQSNSYLADLLARVHAELESEQQKVEGAFKHALRAGALLIEAKRDLVPYGQWETWCRSAGLAPRTVRVRMQLAKHAEEPRSADLCRTVSINYMLKHMAKPKPKLPETEPPTPAESAEPAAEERPATRTIFTPVEVVQREPPPPPEPLETVEYEYKPPAADTATRTPIGLPPLARIIGLDGKSYPAGSPQHADAVLAEAAATLRAATAAAEARPSAETPTAAERVFETAVAKSSAAEAASIRARRPKALYDLTESFRIDTAITLEGVIVVVKDSSRDIGKLPKISRIAAIRALLKAFDVSDDDLKPV